MNPLYCQLHCSVGCLGMPKGLRLTSFWSDPHFSLKCSEPISALHSIGYMLWVWTSHLSLFQLCCGARDKSGSYICIRAVCCRRIEVHNPQKYLGPIFLLSYRYKLFYTFPAFFVCYIVLRLSTFGHSQNLPCHLFVLWKFVESLQGNQFPYSSMV